MRALRPLAGIGICIGTSVFLCFLLNESAETRFVAPAVSLQAVILVAFYFGRTAALVGSVAASLIFVEFLFPPIGSFLVRDRVEMGMLLLFQASSIVIAWLSPRPWLSSQLRSHYSHPFSR